MSTAIPDRLARVSSEALGFVAQEQANAIARQWLDRSPPATHAQQWPVARSLALELLLIKPSISGTTAFDRLARAIGGRPADDIAAAALLRRSRLRIARLSRQTFEDLATGEIRTLLPTPFSDSTGDGVSMGLFVAIGDSHVFAARPLVALDDKALALARGFARPGNLGIGNAVRCAEVVYRHIVRSGAGSFGATGSQEPRLPFRPDENKLDALAAAWAALGCDPTEQELARARGFAGQNALMASLLSVGIARDGGAPQLAAAYTRIAAVIMETMALRSAHGSVRGNLDAVAAAIDAEVARGTFTPAAQALFNVLRERVRMSQARPAADSADLDRLVQRIRALREKTVERGCTEQEAMSAAEKVAELLDRHGLNLSELDLRRQTCEGIGVETDRKRRGPIDDCMTTIAGFFDCRVWVELAEDGTLRYIFFGLPADVQAAVYLHDLIALAFASETARFQAGDFYRSADSGNRRSATNSFQIGLARGINQKLEALRRSRETADARGTGRALVPVKDAMIDDEMERLGFTFERRTTSRRRVLSTAYNAGKEAGARFEYHAGIAQNRPHSSAA